MEWSNNPDGECIFWLRGIAGTGKSTIARTVADEWGNIERLGASFFFSKGGVDLGNATKFFTTIAFQLSQVSPDIKHYICEAVKKHPDIAQQALRDQWKRLVFGPLAMLKADSTPSPLVLVVDALDECDEDQDVKQVLQLLAEAKTLKTVRLRIFLTSRPETPIRLSFHNMSGNLHRDLVLNDVPRAIADNDIRIFFEHKSGANRSAWDDLPVDWPGKETIDLLVLRAHGLFIYAATVCQFIEENGEQWSPNDLLHLILPHGRTTDSSLWKSGNTVITHELPTKELDTMYTQILEHSLKNVHNEKDKQLLVGIFRQVVGAIVNLFDPLSIIAIVGILPFNESTNDIEGLHLTRSKGDWIGVLDVMGEADLPRNIWLNGRDTIIATRRGMGLKIWVRPRNSSTTMKEWTRPDRHKRVEPRAPRPHLPTYLYPPRHSP